MKRFNLLAIPKVYANGLSRTAIARVINELSTCVGVNGYELHHQLFGEAPFYTKEAKAKKALEELGVFECINFVKLYECRNFGDFITAIEPCSIANMMCYIMGEFIHKSEHLTRNCWDTRLTEDDLVLIEAELQTYLESLDEDLAKVVLERWNF